MNKGKVKGYILVRDRNGKPKFDTKQIPQDIWDNILTNEEREELINGGYTPRNN